VEEMLREVIHDMLLEADEWRDSLLVFNN